MCPVHVSASWALQHWFRGPPSAATKRTVWDSEQVTKQIDGIYLCFEEGADDLLLVHVISMEGEEEGEMV